MRRSSVTASATLHLIVLILFTISLPFFKHTYDIPPPVSVELVDISQLSQTTKAAPKPVEKPPTKPPEEKKTDRPQPAPTSKASTPTPPTPKPPEKVEKETKPEEKVVDENAPPKKAEKKPDKKPVVKKEEPPKDFASILKNLAEPKATPAPPMPDAQTAKMAQPNQGQPLPIGERMTMSEEDALRKQLEGCWNVPYGAKDAENTTVDVYMVINQDRTLMSAQIVDMGRYNSDSFFRAMADSAMRAVRNPQCSPFDLPADKYEAWKTITVTFDPSQMF
jgi:outer membrane biosynthesis protein TonB